MGGKAEIPDRFYLLKYKRLISGLEGIYNDDLFMFGKKQGIFHLELVISLQGQAGQVSFFKLGDKGRTQAVILPPGIPYAVNQDVLFNRGFRGYFLLRSTSWPLESYISTSSGIWPRAWVAQLRQGS